MLTTLLTSLLFDCVLFLFGLTSYIDRLSGWWPPAKVAASIGVPGYAPKNAYTTFNLAFWTSSSGPVDAALVWADAYKYVSSQNPWVSASD